MVKRVPTYLPTRVNRYVPAMAYAADAEDGKITNVIFGAPAAASAAAILSATDTTVAGSTTTLLDTTSDAAFGQNVTVVASGADTGTITVKGRDFWGQPMAETITKNGATPVLGTKAFFILDSVSWTAVATTMNVGWGSKLGLPYKMDSVLNETADDVLAAAGTLTAHSAVDPATATTTDPRGTYTPTTTANGVKVLAANFIASNYANAAGNGGLLGIQHYYA